MIKPLAFYPRFLWLGLIAIAINAAIPKTWNLSIIAACVLALAGPIVRNMLCHPLGMSSQAYFLWLKTSPWQPGMALPNGRTGPTWQDALFGLLLLAPAFISAIVGLLDPILVLYVLMLILNCWFGMAAALNWRYVFFLGKRSHGYFIAALILMGLQLITITLITISPAKLIIAQFAMLPAYGVSLYFMKEVDSRYPWDFATDISTGKVAITFSEWINLRAMLASELGATMLNLKPVFAQPLLCRTDRIGIAVLLVLFYVPVCLSSDWKIKTFFLGGILLVVYLIRLFHFFSYGLPEWSLIKFRHRMPKVHAVSTGNISLLAAMTMLTFISERIHVLISPILIALGILTILWWPPTTRVWETMGRKRLPQPNQTKVMPEANRRRQSSNVSLSKR